MKSRLSLTRGQPQFGVFPGCARTKARATNPGATHISEFSHFLPERLRAQHYDAAWCCGAATTIREPTTDQPKGTDRRTPATDYTLPSTLDAIVVSAVLPIAGDAPRTNIKAARLRSACLKARRESIRSAHVQTCVR